MASSSPHVFDRGVLRLRRDRAAGKIAEYDFLLQEVAGRLIDRLSIVKRHFPLMLDLGSAHGVMAKNLSGLPGVEHVFSTEISSRLAAMSAGGAIVADEEYLPFADDSFDAVISNLSLQWVNDLPGALLQLRRALKPDGLFMAAIMGGETLSELRHALMTAEIEVVGGASPRVSPLVDLRDMGALMQRAGYALPVIDSEIITVDYPHMFRLMQDLRGMGATNVVSARLKTPTRKAVLMRAAEIYQQEFGTADGMIPARFEVIFVIGWKPHESQQKPSQRGSGKVSLADIL